MRKVSIVMVLFLLTGCAPFQGFFEPENERLNRIAVKAITARMLTNNPSWIPQTADLSEKAIDFLDNETLVSVDEMVKWVTKEIEWKDIQLEEQVLLEEVIDIIASELREDMNFRGIPEAEQIVHIRKVFVWINEVAEMRN